jgi:transposase-like protein
MNRKLFSEPQFHNERAAYAFCQSWLWPAGPVCPRNGCTRGKVQELKGKSTRYGTYKCYECCRPFTVKIGTVFQGTHLKLHLWLQAIYLVSFTRGGITVRDLQQTLGIALKTAGVLNRRIRELIARDDGLAIMGELSSAAILASAITIDRDSVKAGSKPRFSSAIKRASESKSEPKQDGKRPSRRPPRQPDPKQLNLFEAINVADFKTPPDAAKIEPETR